MKKQSTLNFKVLFSTLALSFLTGQVFADNILPMPQNVPSEPGALKGELYGPEITSCQEFSGGWKASKPDFNGFALREMSNAAKTFNDTVKSTSPNMGSFLKGKEGLSAFIDFRSGKVKEGYSTFIGTIGGVRTTFILSSNLIGDTKGFEQCPGNANPLTSGEDSCYMGQQLSNEPLKGQYIEEKEVRDFLDSSAESAITAYKSDLDKILQKVARCSALYSVVSNGAANRGMNINEFNKTQSAKSFDGKLKCESLGYETQDYKACKDATTYYDAVFLGRKAVETVQQFQYMDKSMDIQTEMAKNAQTDAAAGLKAQKQDIQQKAEMARTRAATETAAVGALWAAMEQIPSLEELSTECSQKMQGFANSTEMETFKRTYEDYYNKTVVEKIGLTSNSSETARVLIDNVLESACEKYVADVQRSSHALIQNGDAREIIQQALIDAGVNIATMLGTAEILDKQAGRVGDAIKLVNDHDPESLAYDSQDVLATECQINPGSENCVNAKYERGVGYHNDGISVSGLQFATSDSTLPIDETTRNTEAAGDNTNRTNTIGGIGATIDAVDKGSGLADSPLGAASVSTTGANGLGSGGGGGGAAGGGASAPANGSARTGGQGANKPYVGSSKKVKYSGGSGLSFSSGARRVAKKEKAENPFSSLFGKKGANKNGVLNFRGVASDVGSKNGSIFQMISKRYSAVSKDKRLEEYQKVNK